VKSFQIRIDAAWVRRTLFSAAALLVGAAMTLAQTVPVVTGDARVDKLLSQMTLDEKLTLIHGIHEDPDAYQGQAGYLGGIPRLGIPGLRFADGPPGVLTRHPSHAETATMGVAATFSTKTAEQNGLVIGREARALGIDVALQPFVNIDRDLEFGRGYNTFGEDPFLTGAMAVGEIKGIQSQHVMAQIKHYVGYDSNGSSTFIDDQTLHEVYVAPFDAAIRKAERNLCLRQQGRADHHSARPDRLQRLCDLRLGGSACRELYQRRPGHGDARRTGSRWRRLLHPLLL